MEPKNQNRNLKDYLIKRIKQSGYPLEIRISDILNNDEYYVSNTQYYFDEDYKRKTLTFLFLLSILSLFVFNPYSLAMVV